MAKSLFKLEHPLERTPPESARIREKYLDRMPVIVERAEKSDVPDIDKKNKLRNMRLVRGVKNGLKCGSRPSITWSMGESLPLHAICVSPSNTCLQCQANS